MLRPDSIPTSPEISSIPKLEDKGTLPTTEVTSSSMSHLFMPDLEIRMIVSKVKTNSAVAL